MSATTSPSLPKPMPQIDFGKAFSPSDEQVAPRSPEDASHARPFGPKNDDADPAKFRPRLGRSDWTNILFVIIAILGGLFCAFYFFNGAELLRNAAAWPAEFLYSRPFAFANGKIDKFDFAATQPSSAGATSPSASQPAPFAHSAAPLQGLNQSPPPNITAAGPAGASPSSASPGIGSLGQPAPGGGALMQAFNNAVGNLQNAATRNANRTVVVLQTAVKQTKQRTRNLARNAGHAAQTHIGMVNGQLASTTKNSTAAATSTVASAQNQTTNQLRSTSNYLPLNASGLGGGMHGGGGFGGGGGGLGGGGGGLSGGGLGTGGLGGGALGGLGGAIGAIGGGGRH